MSAEGQAEQKDESMEEILQSIKRIIADDEEEQPASENKEQSVSEEIKPIDSDILELTDMVREDGTVTNIKDAEETEVEEQSADLPMPEGPEAEEPEAEEPEVEEPAVQAEPEPEPAPVTELDALVSEEAAQASSEALKSLAQNTPAKPQPTKTTPSPVFRSGETVEDLVLEALRPMLKEWLDANLPILVERLVQKEIDKISS